MVVVPFNGGWFAFLGVMAVIGIALHLLLRRRPELIQRRTLTGVAIGSVVLYTWYTFNSILDPNVPEVVLAQNLPFHLCNLVAWALIPAYLLRPRTARFQRYLHYLRAFCFFPGALAGLLTLTSPVPVYIGHPIFSLPAIGFYGVHSLNVILGTLLATLGLYRGPCIKDALRSVVHLAVLSILIFPLDFAMRAWVDPHTNYFYLFEPENAEILVAVHDIVGIPLLYVMLLLPVALIGVLIQALGYRGLSRLIALIKGTRPTTSPDPTPVSPDRFCAAPPD